MTKRIADTPRPESRALRKRGRHRGYASSSEDTAPSAHPAETLDGAAQLAGVHARVALRGVEVLVAEQVLDLAQVRARVQELRSEHVTERVRRDALALVYAGGIDVVTANLTELRGGEEDVWK